MTKRHTPPTEGKLSINFEQELDDNGEPKITKGRKYRYKEAVDPTMGMVVGTLYVAEHAVLRLGTPTSITVTIE